jgi:hypothetical protein
MEERTRLAAGTLEQLARACSQTHRMPNGAVLWDFDPRLWAAHGKNTPEGEKANRERNLLAIQTAGGNGTEQYHQVRWDGAPGSSAWIEFRPRGGDRALRLPVIRDDSAPREFRLPN